MLLRTLGSSLYPLSLLSILSLFSVLRIVLNVKKKVYKNLWRGQGRGPNSAQQEITAGHELDGCIYYISRVTMMIYWNLKKRERIDRIVIIYSLKLGYFYYTAPVPLPNLMEGIKLVLLNAFENIRIPPVPPPPSINSFTFFQCLNLSEMWKKCVQKSMEGAGQGS